MESLREQFEPFLWPAVIILTVLGLGYGLFVTGETNLGSDEIELVYWVPISKRVMELPSVRAFERQNPGIRVRVAAMSRTMGTSDPTKLIVGMAGGAPPDLIYIDRFTVGGFAARDAFLPLDDYIDQSDVIDPVDYFPATIAEAKYEGKTYALPNSIDVRALYYNKDLLIRDGFVDEDGNARPPKTWKELHAAAKKMTKKNSKGRITQVGFIPNWGNSFFYMYSFQNGGAFLSPDGKTCTLAAPENVEALQFMTGIYDDLGGVENVDAYSASFQGGDENPFYKGQVAMYISGDWELDHLSQVTHRVNFGVAPAPVPEGKPYVTWSGGYALAIPKGAARPDLGWKLLEFLRSEETVLRAHKKYQSYFRSRGSTYLPSGDPSTPINRKIMASFVQNNPNFAPSVKEAVGVFNDLRGKSKFRPVTPVGKLLWDEHVRAFERATHHLDTATDALKKSEHRVQVELDRLAERSTDQPISWGLALPLLMVLTLGLLAFVIWLDVKRRGRRADKGMTIAGYLFASPFLIGFLVLTVGPILASMLLSMTSYDGLGDPQWIGFTNYLELLSSEPLFWVSLWNTVFMILGLPLGMALGLGMAMLLEKETRGMRFYRTIFYLPAIMPIVAASVLWIWILHPESGVLNESLRMMGFDDPPNWLHGTGSFFGFEFYWSKPSLIIMGLWGVGSGMIIWLAGLKGIPQSLNRAAAIDGANAWQRFRHVTLPMLSPTIFFQAVMGVIWTFQIFTQAYIMTAGGPADSTRFYAYYLFDNAFRYFKMGSASAMAWILFAIVLVLTLVQLKLGRSWVHYQEEA